MNNQQRAYQMHRAGHGYQRIAEFLKVSVPTAKAYVSRARVNEKAALMTAEIVRLRQKVGLPVAEISKQLGVDLNAAWRILIEKNAL